MQTGSNDFVEQATAAMAQPQQRATREALGEVLPAMRSAGMAQLGNFEAARKHLARVRRHTLDHLDHYLAQFEQQALRNGNHLHYARSGDELNDIVLSICRDHDAQRVIKGKSMVTEETHLNAHLQRAGLQVTETDLGEYIVQQAGETPSHIVGPATHKSLDEVRELFRAKHALGERDLEQPADLVAEARGVLREHFLEADVGIIGANALIAENGYSMLVTNEGNGDLCANLPNVLIVCTTIERVLPRAADATSLLRLLVRSATGQDITCYTSFYSGPRREDDPDGPLEVHFVLLDNQRSELLASDYRDMLQCLRCGACLNHCPIFVAAGGHAYGSVYPGPMGSVLTPLLTSLEQAQALPNACTSCGRCEEVCPADIPLPALLRDLRHDAHRNKLTPRRWRWGLSLHRQLAAHPRLYQRLTNTVMRTLRLFSGRRGHLQRLPFASAWTGQRNLPSPQGETFMMQYRRQHRD
jgi:L-lactate dehydrogenase complex protein LldF